MPVVDELQLRGKIAEVLDRWPSAGLAVGVVRDGSLEWFFGHGVADVGSKEPITQDTVFRIGSITKTFTAVAVMQLWEQGLVDLDAPANDYLRALRLIPAKASFRPATVRHLLTHTAGVGYWRRLSDLLQPGVGSGNRFAPLGMEHTDLVRSERVRPHLATGYVLRSRGLKPVADREVLTPGGSAMYSTTADMAHYLAALLHGGTGERGSVLKPDTLVSMFQPQFQPDPRVPGMGLGFEPGEESGHATVGKAGILSGFLSAMVLAPDDGIGVVVFSNTGGLDGRGVSEPLAAALLRRLLGLPDEVIRADIPVRPDSWSQVCGWYSPDPGPVTNLFVRALLGAGAEVTVHDGHLMLKPLTPVPAMRRGLRLYPDDPDDPWVFRADLPEFGKSPRVVFSGGPEQGGAATRLLMDLMSLQKRPEVRNPRPWMNGVLAAGAAALAIRRGLHRRASG